MFDIGVENLSNLCEVGKEPRIISGVDIDLLHAPEQHPDCAQVGHVRDPGGTPKGGGRLG